MQIKVSLTLFVCGLFDSQIDFYSIDLSFYKTFLCYRKHDDVKVGTSNFQRATRTGASLRASTRGEIGSNMLQRSVRSRRSLKAISEPTMMA